MVLAHVDSGNDITDTEYGLPKWVNQCGGGNYVDVEVHMGCGQTLILAENNKLEEAIIGFNKIVTKLKGELGFQYNGYDKTSNSQGGMILRDGYNIVKVQKNMPKKLKNISVMYNYKILKEPEVKDNEELLNEQIFFIEELTNKLSPQKQRCNAIAVQEEIAKQIKEKCFVDFEQYFNANIKTVEDIKETITEKAVSLIRFDEVKPTLDEKGYDFTDKQFTFNININKYKLLENGNKENLLSHVVMFQLKQYKCNDKTL
jgi:hypothetical protein